MLAGAGGLIPLWCHLTWPLLACGGGCFVDYVTVRGDALARVEVADARLNAWILGWVHHALLTAPSSLFDANVFYPVRNALAASEHLLGIAVPLLPLGIAGAGAVALHQTALVSSFLLSALTTFALVRWLTGSNLAASAAGAAALFMPWRIAEVSHVQLLNSQWFPLVWLLLGRILYRDRPRAAAVWLAAVLTVQVLTSFYLAYFLLASCAVLIPVLWFQTGVERDSLLRLGAAAVVPAALLGLAALPYLTWQQTTGFVPVAELFDSVSPADAWLMLGPELSVGLGRELPRPITYKVPLAVGVLALAALAPGRAAARGAEGRERRRRGFAIGLWATSAAAVVLVLGRELQLGDLTIALPAEWLAQIVPGFDKLRSPLRWALVIGIALPVLAGIGVWRLERLAAAQLGERAGAWSLRALVATALVLSLPWGRIPARPAGPDDATRALYRKLASLPDGPVVEVPWSLAYPRNVDLSTRYMLGSTLHWKPIVNGSSGYYPRPHALLTQVAARLPRPEAVAQLQRLVGPRWLVVHGELLPIREASQWTRVAREQRLRTVYRSGPDRIYELPNWEEGGRYREALLSTQPRPRSLAGLPREPLVLDAPAGRLEARFPGPLFYRGNNRMPSLVSLSITNASDVAWPGFDVFPYGLVRVRYTFEGPEGSAVLTETAPLIVDVPPRSTLRTTVALRPPTRAGPFLLRLELVQHLGREAHPLPVTPAELDVVVQAAAALPLED